MPSLRLTVQTITPLLMYGADQQEPELRGASFRGILRYWLRAVLGAQGISTQQVYEKESAILGSTEKGSRVKIRIQQPRATQPERDLWVLPERTSRGYRARYEGFPPNSEFRISLSTHPLDAANDLFNENSAFIKALFLMAHIGGVGRRARRGSGNLLVLDAKDYDGTPALANISDSRNDLRGYLHEVATHIQDTPLNRNRPPDFTTFAPDTAVILLGNSAYATYEDAFQDLWSTSGPYHHSGGIFGDVHPRHASMVHMRVAYTREGYVPQQTIFYAGSGAWGVMQQYIAHCQRANYEKIYGDERNWS